MWIVKNKMEKNIFEGAKFGDKFLTKNNHIAVLLGVYDDYVCVCTDDGTIEEDINLDGTLKYEPLEDYDYTIVSKYQEPIDKENLDKLAWYEAFKKYDIHSETENIMQHRDGFVEGFKAGYYKAKEE